MGIQQLCSSVILCKLSHVESIHSNNIPVAYLSVEILYEACLQFFNINISLDNCKLHLIFLCTKFYHNPLKSFSS